jgi:hypothetical protein
MQRLTKLSFFSLWMTGVVSCSSGGSSSRIDNSTSTKDIADVGTLVDQDEDQNVNTDSSANSIAPPDITNHIFTKADPFLQCLRW